MKKTREAEQWSPTAHTYVTDLERDGYASELAGHHQTYITDPEVRLRIQKMSYLESMS